MQPIWIFLRNSRYVLLMAVAKYRSKTVSVLKFSFYPFLSLLSLSVQYHHMVPFQHRWLKESLVSNSFWFCLLFILNQICSRLKFKHQYIHIIYQINEHKDYEYTFVSTYINHIFNIQGIKIVFVRSIFTICVT